MKPVVFKTVIRKLLADAFTPVGIYLRLRDRFRDLILLESTDHQAAHNCWSFIGVNAIAGFEMVNNDTIEYRYPNQKPERIKLRSHEDLQLELKKYLGRFAPEQIESKEGKYAQGVFGYTCYDTVQFFDTIPGFAKSGNTISLLRYRFYQYVIAFNHFHDALFLCENQCDGIESTADFVEDLIRGKDIPQFPFGTKGEVITNLSNPEFIEMTKAGIKHCLRGDVFQIVLSRKYQQAFTGDDFNVYRALRSVNPSPYLFYFDYGEYHIMGSSPESQLIIENGTAIVHPIAGTYPRSGNDEQDKLNATRLLDDAKENAEHVMLVDLARNDLSRVCQNVKVTRMRQIQYYSHVIHITSEVTGQMKEEKHAVDVLAAGFPAGTLSGAPKIRAIQLINELEPACRGFYGGAIGFLGFNGDCNHAIMIRTLLSQNNTLVFQAGAGVTAASDPQRELEEVENKIGALNKSIKLAAELFK